VDIAKLSREETAEIMRKKYRYRELILSGRLVLSHERAAQLLGPDCLYHLYGVGPTQNQARQSVKPKSKTRKRP
jgi:hypothetical protein